MRLTSSHSLTDGVAALFLPPLILNSIIHGIPFHCSDPDLT